MTFPRAVAYGARGLFVLLVGALGCATAEAPDLGVEDDVVTVSGGRIAGMAVGPDGDVRAYLGIPYAAPPVGELRWRPPRPVRPWDGVRQAIELPPGCMQSALPGSPDSAPFFGAGATQFDEDCLYLNVWSAARPGDDVPVMVWIHGGGLFVGDGSEVTYDGTRLAARGVVIVTINYRLGPFGYLAHPVLRAESPRDSSGNYGVLDQIAALQWVQDNITRFGGDADRVTIFGESAGSWSVNYLMATPLASGLFASAIGQSGGAFGPLARPVPRDEAEASGEMIARDLLGQSASVSLEALRAVPAADLLGAGGNTARPNIDGWVLPDSVHGIFAAGRQNDVPVIIGANADEGTALRALAQVEGTTTVEAYRARAEQQYGALASQFLAAYPVETAQDVVPRLIDSTGDGSFVWEMRAWARMMETVSSPAYLYLFTRVPPAHNADEFGAYHTAEIPYVFNNLGGGSRFWYANRDYDDADRRLSDLMSSYWLNFAATGNPNGEGLPEWPIHARDGDALLELGDEVKVRHGVRQERLDFFDRYYAAQFGLDAPAAP